MRNVLLASCLISALASAQGSTLCQFSSNNTTFDDGISMGGPNLLLGIKLNAGSALVVSRIEMFTGEGNGTNTVGIWSHDPSTNMPLANLGSGSWTMSAANGWQGANITPVVVLPGQDFWLVWGPINGAQASVELRGSPVAPGAQFYRGSFDNGQSWSGGANGFQSHLWKYRIICGGTPGSYQTFGSSCAGSGRTRPTLGFSGVPTVGQPMPITIASALANTAALLAIGNSNTSWIGVPLPLDLTPFGASGCNVLCNVLDFVTTSTDALGAGGVPLPIPADITLVGAHLFNQWWVLDPTANALQLAFSNGGQGIIGN